VSCRDGILCVADPTALGQVLGHLIENAIKYTPDGGEVELVGGFEGNSVVITVADSGPGLPEGDLFEPFRRGENAPGTKGTGLGLYVARTLVVGMGGSIEASNSPSGGAEFRITLRSG
jgi:signal transduction histidine kinase